MNKIIIDIDKEIKKRKEGKQTGRKHAELVALEIIKEKQKEENKMTKEDYELLLGELGLKRYFGKIKEILKEYMDLKEEYYDLISLWIVGSYFHKQFPTFPYLFINAMKSSGKTRLLKIISSLAKNGRLAGSMTESVLFRTAGQRTLCIDEFEGNAKGQENLKLLLNSAYKRGLGVERTRKTKGGEYEIESFDVYCPIALSNIWGMSNVLADRCITIILEKSDKKNIIKLIENFEDNREFRIVCGGLQRITKKILPDLNMFGHIFEKWNSYQKNIVNGVSKVSKVSKVSNVNNNKKPTLSYDNDDIYATYTPFLKIDKSGLSGRDLELFFPLLIIADMIDPELLDKLLKTAKNIVKRKREADREENKDVQLIEFISQSNYTSYTNVSEVVKDFKDFMGQEEAEFINSRGVSRALNRLGLIISRRSTGKARQIKLNVEKAKKKLLMFKTPDEINKPETEKPDVKTEKVK